MEPQQKVTWKDLRIGIMTLISFAIVAITIILMGGGEVEIFKESVQYRTFFPEANGLKSGSEVWLAGVEVGQVNVVRFADPDDIEAVAAIEVVLSVDAAVQNRIRKDSVASLRTIGLLGDKYVEIQPGTPDSPVVPPDGIITGISLSTFDELVGVGRTTARGFNELMVELRRLAADINDQEGTLGRLIHGEELYHNINATLTETNNLLKTAQSGPGTVGRLMASDSLYRNLILTTRSTRQTLATLDSTMRATHAFLLKLQNPEGTIGRLTTDTELYGQLKTMLDRIDALTQKIERGEGTFGRLTQEETISKEMEGMLMDIRALVRDVRENPDRYLKVSVF